MVVSSGLDASQQNGDSIALREVIALDKTNTS
jgi:hypothetical protein